MIGSTLLAPRAGSGFATHPPHEDYWYTERGAPTASGVAVGEETAMSYAAIFACVNKRAKTIATLPVHVYRELPNDRKEKVQDNRVRRMFTVRPNDEALAVPTRWAMEVNLALWGNAYFEVIRDRSNEPLAMSLLYSRYMTVDRDDSGRLVYIYREPGHAEVQLDSTRMLHIAGMGFNGLVGKSVITLQRESAGVGLATAEYRAAFLGNGAAPGIVIERPTDAPELSEVAGERLVTSFDRKHKTSGNAFRTALLREGMTLKTIGMSMVDAQYVELSRFDRETWCGIFDVPPAMIQDFTRGTYSNSEQQGLQWSTGGVLPECVLIESAVKATFFDGTDLYLKHNLDGLQRGDFRTRHEAYRIGREIGLYATNEIRTKEELNPIDGGDDDFLRPLNMGVKGEEPPDVAAEMVEKVKEPLAEVFNEFTVTVNAGMSNLETAIARKPPPDFTPVIERIDRARECTMESTVSVAGALTAVDAKAERLGELIEESGQRHERHVRTLAETQTEQWQRVVGELMLVSNGVAQLRDDDDERTRTALRGLLLDPATRIVAKETKAVAGAWNRHMKAGTPEGFMPWLDKFYTTHQADIYEFFRVTADYVAGQLGVRGPDAHAALQVFATADAGMSLAALQEASVSSRSLDAVSAELERWKDEKPGSMAYRLLERLGGKKTTEATEATEERTDE